MSEWTAAYPDAAPDSTQMPQAWKDALNAAVQAGKIPDIPPTTVPAGQNPVYANGLDPMSPQVCSSTYKCRIPTDVWDAPDGVVGISFDDGPLPVSFKFRVRRAGLRFRALHRDFEFVFFVANQVYSFAAFPIAIRWPFRFPQTKRRPRYPLLHRCQYPRQLETVPPRHLRH